MLQPVIIGRAVQLSPPATMVAALVGVSAGGVVGGAVRDPDARRDEGDLPRAARTSGAPTGTAEPRRFRRVTGAREEAAVHDGA